MPKLPQRCIELERPFDEDAAHGLYEASGMNDDQFLIEWQDGYREPSCAPNPAYPNGIDIDVSDGKKTACTVSRPDPAKRCGFYVVRCKLCDFSVAVTTAGRVDDPKSVTLPCRLKSEFYA